ncbi:hypothetical protein NE237_015560 [Protea cynaroides]|uniref:Uncharacterized protein n=1 Tax=Protea cynaroides TaxID=273540 RepID=A0A9Q0KEG6_9MAGN|nr:hypothetical protein NE237_015560 [Protea cynaroides]
MWQKLQLQIFKGPVYLNHALVKADVGRKLKCQSQSMDVRLRTPNDYIFSRTVMTPRFLLLSFAAAVMCFGVCAVVLHPHKVGEFAISIRRCLLSNHEEEQ